MSSDLDARLHEAALASVRAGKPLADVIGDVLGLAAAEMPSPAWDALAAVDTAADVAKSIPWMLRQIEERPMPDDLAGLWFGLYVVRGPVPGRTEPVMALSGGAGYPAPDWLAHMSWEGAGYAPAVGLRSLMPLTASESGELRALVAGPVVFAYSLGLAAAMLDGADAAQVLDGREQLGVVVGVPDGETVVLGTLTANGLDRSDLHRVEKATPDAAIS